MRRTALYILAAACALPAVVSAQKPTAATYITDEEVKKVNSTPGVDRQIRVVDVGDLNFAVGVVHRGATGAARGAGAGAGAATTAGAGRGAATTAGAATGAGRGAGAGAAQSAGPCGEQVQPPPAGGQPGGISLDSQTEGYLIISGGGTLVTGGKIVNGSKSAPDGAVTKELNGPSCSGMIVGSDVVKKVVKVGDIIIIPAGVPHGWSNIPDHVDYLSFRPSADTLTVGYTHPSLKK